MGRGERQEVDTREQPELPGIDSEFVDDTRSRDRVDDPEDVAEEIAEGESGDDAGEQPCGSGEDAYELLAMPSPDAGGNTGGSRHSVQWQKRRPSL